MKAPTWYRNYQLEFTVVAVLVVVMLSAATVMFSLAYANDKHHKELVKCVRQGHNAVIYDRKQDEYICYNKGVLK